MRGGLSLTPGSLLVKLGASAMGSQAGRSMKTSTLSIVGCTIRRVLDEAIGGLIRPRLQGDRPGRREIPSADRWMPGPPIGGPANQSMAPAIRAARPIRRTRAWRDAARHERGSPMTATDLSMDVAAVTGPGGVRTVPSEGTDAGARLLF